MCTEIPPPSQLLLHAGMTAMCTEIPPPSQLLLHAGMTGDTCIPNRLCFGDAQIPCFSLNGKKISTLLKVFPDFQ